MLVTIFDVMLASVVLTKKKTEISKYLLLCSADEIKICYF